MEKTEEQLVVEYNQGIEESRKILVEKYKKDLNRYSNKFFLYGLTKDDIVSVGSWGLHKAIITFKEGQCAFRPYALTCIRNEILTEIRKTYKNVKFYSMNDETLINFIERKIIDYSNSSEENSDLKECVQKITRKLSKQEKEVLDLFQEGYKQNEISEKLGITRKAVERTISRIRNKLKTIVERG